MNLNLGQIPHTVFLLGRCEFLCIQYLRHCDLWKSGFGSLSIHFYSGVGHFQIQISNLLREYEVHACVLIKKRNWTQEKASTQLIYKIFPLKNPKATWKCVHMDPSNILQRKRAVVFSFAQTVEITYNNQNALSHTRPINTPTDRWQVGWRLFFGSKSVLKQFSTDSLKKNMAFHYNCSVSGQLNSPLEMFLKTF